MGNINKENATRRDKLLSLEVAAERLGVSVWTIRAWARDNRINTVKLGSRRLISESEVDRLVRNGLPARTEQQCE